ncbi:hypothetical protein [Ureibacillus acetophenoni]|uniref:Uncharacterized protein n=1 Tax=Ureibacillus acetophenoni TaxID=614649 RepID=A0A285UNI3_9BACL|nr:hypothetical protein [Ureibacillus acetophenoni]SOC43277.1 hypothetical protein SAMN05877842_11560 [Ureibacillus acetophenoni]
MKILLRIYLVITQIIYIFTLLTWFRWAMLALAVLENNLTFDIVLWILFLPVLGYPLLIVSCAFYSWKSHNQKPIRSLIMNTVPILWIIAHSVLWLNLST